jgi:hypothetical protein
LHITNINTFLYSISIQTRDTITERELKLPGYSFFDIPSIQTAASGLSPLELLKGSPIFRIGKPDKMGRRPKVDTTYELTPSQKRENEVRKLMDSEKVKLETTEKNLNVVKNQIDSLFFKTKIFMLSPYIEDASASMFNTFGWKEFSTEIFIRDIDEIHLSLVQTKKEIVNDSIFYSEYTKGYRDVIAHSSKIKIRDTEIKQIYNQLINHVGEVLDSINITKYAGLLKDMIEAENNRKHEYVSLPFQLTGDQTKMHITIEPRGEKSSLQTYSTDYVFPRAKNWFMGVGSSFYVSFLHDDAYSTVTISTDTSYKVIKENPGTVEIGMQAMMIIGFCPSDLGYFFASFGPGISISNKVKPRLLLGGGYAFGKRNLITIGVNLIVGAVDRKSEVIQLDTRYVQKPDQITVSRIEYGVSLTVGYVFNL